MKRLTRTQTGFGIAALAVALAGSIYLSSQQVNAQGRGGIGGRGGFGGPGGRGIGGPGGPGGGPRRGGPMGDMGPLGLPLGRLDLTEAQHEQVKQILDSHKDEQKALGEKSRQAHAALEAATTADPLDEGAVRARANDIAILDSDAAVNRARLYQEVVQILTPDQKTKLKKLQGDMKERQAEMEKKMQERREERR